MALNNIFAALSGNVPAVDLDANFNAVGEMAVTQCTAAGTNAITLTPVNNQPAVAGYQNYQLFGFAAPATSTGPLTAQVNALGLKAVYLANGVQADSGDIIINGYYQLAYDSALASGSGGFHLVSKKSSFKLGTFDRNLSDVSLNIAYTGVGFKPDVVIFIGAVIGLKAATIGVDDGTSHYSINQEPSSSTWNPQIGISIVFYATSSAIQIANIASMDADGFTLAWTKTASPTGTGRTFYMAIKF